MAELQKEISRAFTLRDQTISDLQGRVVKLETENQDLKKQVSSYQTNQSFNSNNSQQPLFPMKIAQPP